MAGPDNLGKHPFVFLGKASRDGAWQQSGLRICAHNARQQRGVNSEFTEYDPGRVSHIGSVSNGGKVTLNSGQHPVKVVQPFYVTKIVFHLAACHGQDLICAVV